MLANAMRVSVPPAGLVVGLFCFVPVVALLVCGTIVWLSKMSTGKRVGGLALTVLGMTLQVGVWYVIIVAAITAMIASAQ